MNLVAMTMRPSVSFTISLEFILEFCKFKILRGSEEFN